MCGRGVIVFGWFRFLPRLSRVGMSSFDRMQWVGVIKGRGGQQMREVVLPSYLHSNLRATTMTSISLPSLGLVSWGGFLE